MNERQVQSSASVRDRTPGLGGRGGRSREGTHVEEEDRNGLERQIGEIEREDVGRRVEHSKAAMTNDDRTLDVRVGLQTDPSIN